MRYFLNYGEKYGDETLGREIEIIQRGKLWDPDFFDLDDMVLFRPIGQEAFGITSVKYIFDADDSEQLFIVENWAHAAEPPPKFILRNCAGGTAEVEFEKLAHICDSERKSRFNIPLLPFFVRLRKDGVYEKPEYGCVR